MRRGRGLVSGGRQISTELEAGDVVTIPAEVKHWHGAKSNCWFSHLAVECPGDNTFNEWLEPVTDEIYYALEEK